jgi:hypothetical protein
MQVAENIAQLPSIALSDAGWIVAADSGTAPLAVVPRVGVFSKSGRADHPSFRDALYPHLAARPDGRIDLLFARDGDTASPGARSGRPKFVKSLWVMSKAASGQFQEPKLLFRNADMEWNSYQSSQVATNGRGDAVSAVIGIDSPHPSPFILRSHAGKGWEVSRVPFAASASYVSVGLLGDTIVLAVIGAGPNETGNSVWTSTSADNGATWSSPVKRSPPGEEAHYVRVATHNGSAHILWVQGSPPVAPNATLQHVVITGDNRSQDVLRDSLGLPMGGFAIRAASSRCGLLVLISDMRSGGGILFAKWNQTWQDAKDIFGTFAVDEADITSDSTGRVAVAFAGNMLASQRDPIRRLFVAGAVVRK